MSFNFWHMTDAKRTPVKNGIGFINIDFYARVTGGGKQIPRMFIDFSRQKFNTIISRATNRAGEHFKTIMLRETSETYYVKQKDVRSSLTLKRAYGRDSFNFTLISKGKRHSLGDYKISPTHPKSGNSLIYGAVKREGGLKPLQHRGDDKPTGFLMKRAGGKYFPYYRVESGRKGIRAYISPSIPQLMRNERNVEMAKIEAQEVFEKRLDYELAKQWGLAP
ncbi:MAG: hypothetical protein IJ587_09690 [Synergistaceae bacterium]|nr:hypothetical protein [Synergistaceae bacterium]